MVTTARQPAFNVRACLPTQPRNPDADTLRRPVTDARHRCQRMGVAGERVADWVSGRVPDPHCVIVAAGDDHVAVCDGILP